MQTANETTVQTFISNVAESKVVVIVPLYGYWSDSPIEQLTPDVLQVALSRVKSSKHKVYIAFVGEPERMTARMRSILLGEQLAGNSVGLQVPSGSPYAAYVNEGLDYALTQTDAQFVVFFHPWIMVKEGSLDQMIERINRGDVGVVSGYEAKNDTPIEGFDNYDYTLPKEERAFTLDYFGLTRGMAEILNFDTGYKTHYFIARDFWQHMYTRSFEVISSQFLPTYSFDLDWTLLEEGEDFERDKAHFIEKWGFDPGINYERK